MDKVKSYSNEWLSPNFGERAENAKPSMIIMHYTNMESAEAALSHMCNAKAEVSAHYCIDEEGMVYQLVEEDKRAWHAGRSYWQGETDINSHSIGIELVNPGHDHGYRAFPGEQIQALTALCDDIKERHDIQHVLAHSDIAPDRKEDPGHLFPWQALAERGIGVWPEDVTPDEFDLLQTLCAIGYAPDCDFVDLIKAFQRHYVPEVYTAGTQGTPCMTTCSRLLGLHKLLSS